MNITNPVGPTSGPIKSSPHLEQVGQQKGPAVQSTSMKPSADSISRTIIPPTNIDFSGAQERKEFPEEANNPVLEKPLEPGEAPLTSPLNPAQQTLVLRFFETKVTEQLKEQGVAEMVNVVLDNQVNGKPIADPKKAALAKAVGKKAAETTAKEINLPPSWTPRSTNPKDWTAKPMSPYGQEEQAEIDQHYDQTLEKAVTTFIAEAKPPLSSEKIALLNQAVKTGKVSSEVAKTFVDLTKQATIATQDKFRLPVSWVKGATDPVDVTPVYSETLSPTNVAQAQLEMTTNNIGEVVGDLKTASAKVLADQPPEVQQEALNYYQALYSALGLIQDAINVSKSSDINVSDEMAKGAKSALLDKIDNSKQYFIKLKKQRAKEAKMAKLKIFMKIFGPILALIALVAAIIPPAAALATIVVSAIFTVYAALDSGLDLTSKAFAGLSDLVVKMMPNATEEQRTAVKIAIVGVMLLAVAGSAAGAMKVMGSAATQAGTQAATGAARAAAAQVTRESVKQAIKMGGIQLGLLLLSGSGALPEAVGLICKSMGLSEKDSMIVQMVMNVVFIIATIAVVSYAIKAAPSAPPVPDERGVAKIIMDYITKLPRAIAQDFKDLANAPKAFMETDGMNRLKVSLQLSPSLVTIATSSYQGAILIDLAKVLKEMGENKAADEMLALLIKLFQNMVNKFQASVGDLGDMADDTQKIFNNIIGSQSELTASIIKMSSRT